MFSRREIKLDVRQIIGSEFVCASVGFWFLAEGRGGPESQHQKTAERAAPETSPFDSAAALAQFDAALQEALPDCEIETGEERGQVHRCPSLSTPPSHG